MDNSRGPFQFHFYLVIIDRNLSPQVLVLVVRRRSRRKRTPHPLIVFVGPDRDLGMNGPRGSVSLQDVVKVNCRS